ncbi:F-box/kelch-repeat protein At3g23880-like [Vicia villosa]|uniref:F-box/kelch-repeat protein At3g23880-like n=1 Tax=Vicia villosa TaxID=3911 RepID=UPI00273CC2BB|nr:F-box/kelch-repeat protein At3g23880-like [Vicia villosa]
MSVFPLFFPNDLILEVLSLLNVKAILRFRCVSKFWDILISNPSFVNLHLKSSEKRNPHFLLLASHTKKFPTKTLYGSDEFEHDYVVFPYSISRLVENPSFTITTDSDYIVQHKECSDIVGSCNGLICLSCEYYNYEYYEYWLRLWNPATRTTSPKFGLFRLYSNTPGCPTSKGCYRFSFGCDNSSGTYKVMASCYFRHQQRSNVKILSLGDNVWRDFESFPVEPIDADYACGTDYDDVYFKSTITWLGIRNKLCTRAYNFTDIKDFTVKHFVIVSLDLRTETYNQYLLPPDFDQVPHRAPIIGVLGDCLCFSYCYKETDFIIWQMKEFGIQDFWTQFLKISYHSLQIHYDYSDENAKYHFYFVPLFFSEDGDTLILHCSREGSQDIIYNQRNNTVKQTKITATKTITDDRIGDPCCCSVKGYFESLVSVF